MAVGISGDASVRYFVRIFALLPPLRVSWCFAQRCSRIATRGSQRGATFPNCNLFRDDHAGTSTFLARFGKWDSGGGEGELRGLISFCALARGQFGQHRRSSRVHQGRDVKHPGWRNDAHSAHCGSNRRQPARISNSAKAIITSSRTLPLPVQQYVISVVVLDPETLQMIDLMLLSWGYLTELYASAEEFLSAAATSEAACIVIDIHLGDISGVDLAIRLAAMGFKVPVIIITESQDEQHRQGAMDFGSTAFLLKPFPADRLSEAIRKAIGLKLH